MVPQDVFFEEEPGMFGFAPSWFIASFGLAALFIVGAFVLLGTL